MITKGEKAVAKASKNNLKAKDAEIEVIYNKCSEQIQELIDYFEAFKILTRQLTDRMTERGKAKINSELTHLLYAEYFQLFSVLMVEHDFRILYDPLRPRLNFKFPYHNVKDEDALIFEKVHHEITKNFKSFSSSTLNAMIKAENLVKHILMYEKK